MKRFYQSVSHENCHLLLDGKPVKTPLGNPLIAPNPTLADMIVKEWEKQKETIDAFSMKHTKLLNQTIDDTMQAPGKIIENIIQWARADLICYRAQEPEALVHIQKEIWQPILEACQIRLKATFPVTTDMIAQPLPEKTQYALQIYFTKLNPYLCTAAAKCAALTASAILTVSLIENISTPDHIWKAANIEQDWQIRKWGRTKEAQNQRNKETQDFYAVVDFIKQTKMIKNNSHKNHYR